MKEVAEVHHLAMQYQGWRKLQPAPLRFLGKPTADMGVSIVMGVSKMVGLFMMENLIKMILKWMIWGYPYFRKPPIFRDFSEKFAKWHP